MAVSKTDYLSRDYMGLRGSLFEYANASLPEWQPSSEGDLGVVLLESFAYVGDILSYYTDRAQFESYLPTATQRDSVLSLAYMLGYTPNSGTPATGTVKLQTGPGIPETIIPAGTQITTNRVAAVDGPVVFETDEEVILAENEGENDPIPVTEGESISYEKIGESNGQPNQIFLLPNAGVYQDTIRVFVHDNLGSNAIYEGGEEIRLREWLAQDHLLEANGSDAVFEVQFNDNATYVMFGDDINGAIPSTGLAIYVSYRFGVGSNGNLPAGEIRFLNDRFVGNVRVEQGPGGEFLSSETIGGTDPETTESIRYNAPRAYRTQSRVVTSQDFVDAALGVQGVRKANVLVGTFTSVTIYITGPDGLLPSTTLKKTVKDRLLGRTLAGVDVTVVDPTFIEVNLGTEAKPLFLRISDQYSKRRVRVATERVIRNIFLEHNFGDPLSVGKFYEAIANIEGVLSIDIPVMARDDATQQDTVTLNPREWEMFILGDLHLSITGGVA